MTSFLIFASALVLCIGVASSNPQGFSGCGPNGCYNVDNNGQGVGCGPGGCGLIGSRNYQADEPDGRHDGVACGPGGCGIIKNNGNGIGCGPGGCGPLVPNHQPSIQPLAIQPILNDSRYQPEPLLQPIQNDHPYATTGDGKCGPHGCTSGNSNCTGYGCVSQ